MHRRASTALTLLALAFTSLATTGATTADGMATGPAPTVIEDVRVKAFGPSIDVDADVDFGGQAPVVLGDDPAGDAPVHPDAGTALGLDLTELRAYVADGDDPVVTLEWQTTRLDRLPPPEIVRYNWPFLVDGTAAFAVQAKTTDLVSAANLGDGQPTTVADNVASYADAGVPGFRLRGDCGTVGVVGNCGHVAWLDGGFDLEGDVVRVQLPVDLAGAAAIRPGATLSPDGGAWASLQAGADTAATRDTIAQYEDYTIPERVLRADLVDATDTVVATAALERGDDGRFRGNVHAPAAGAYGLVVTACFADVCDQHRTDLDVGGTVATAQQIDPAHAGATTGLTGPLAKRWEVDLGGTRDHHSSEVSYPLVADGRAFVVIDEGPSYGPDLVAVDLADGSTLWRVELGGVYYRGAATLGSDAVFAVNGDGVVRAFEPATGRLLWSHALDDGLVGAPPVAAGEHVYLATNGSVTALDQGSGDVVWRAAGAGGGYGTHGAPAVTDASVIVTYPYRTIAYDRTTGAVLWSYEMPTLDTGAGTPVVAGGHVYIRTLRQREVVDAETGELVGTHIGGTIPAFHDGRGFFLTGGSTLEARDELSASTVWSFAGDGDLRTPPVVVDGVVYIAGGRSVHGIDAATGQHVWRGELPYAVSRLDEWNYTGPPVGLGAGDGLLLVPAGPYLVAFGSAG